MGGENILLTKELIVKWNNKNKSYYESKGYIFTNNGEEFAVKIEDATLGCKSEVEVLCDFCQEVVVTKTFLAYNKQHHPKYGDCCIKCQPKKNRLCCLDKYGVNNGSKTPEAVQKIIDTSMERYGVSNPAKSDGSRKKISLKSKENSKTVREKVAQTTKEKYGVDCVLQVKEVRDKIKQTMLEKYGVEHPLSNKEIYEAMQERNIEKYGVPFVSQTQFVKDKTKQTCLEKYGCEYSLQSAEVREKANKTLLEHGKVKTSKQQMQLFNLLKQIYPVCVLNYSVGRCFLDCMVETKEGVKVDVEYDGIFWHQDEQRDRRRDEYIKERGYKILRIRGKRDIPSEEELVKEIQLLCGTQHTYSMINMV